MHVITGLSSGGAESMLSALATADVADGMDVLVVSLVPGGLYHDRLLNAGVRVLSLEMRRGIPSPAALFRLMKLLRDEQPDVVQSWMYHADLVSTLGLVFSGRRRATRFYWGIRCSDMDTSSYGRQLSWVIRLLAWMSGLPDGVVANSRRGIEVHQQAGYHPRKFYLVYNGIDLTRFSPDPSSRQETRHQLGVSPDTFLVAMLARNDPMKDFTTFYQALEYLPEVEAIVAGSGTPELPSHTRIHRLGVRDDVPQLLNACDIVVSSSAFGEGLSNAVAEGMACGLPAVVTDVGDSALLVGDCGRVVPPGDAKRLAAAIQEIQEHGSLETLGKRARDRIVDRFSLASAVGRFRELHTTGSLAAS